MDFRIIVLISLIPFSYPQFIQIHDISNNPGALIMKVGEGRISLGYDKVLHIIELNQFKNSITTIKNVLNRIDNKTGDFSNLIELKLSMINDTFMSLLPRNRKVKRSIEVLGSTIKLITGNLDAQDLRNINADLYALKNNENSLLNENNKQISINANFQERINIVNNQIKDHENSLAKILLEEDYLITESTKISILFQLDMLLNSLHSIENSLSLVKVNIINKQILSNSELEVIAAKLTKQGFKIDSLDEVCVYLTTTAFYQGENIIISINIPNVQPIVFDKMLLLPLPVNNKTANIDHKVIFKHENETLAVSTGCQETPKITLCKRELLINISADDCIAPLIRGLNGKCPFSELPQTIEYELPAPGTIIVKALTNKITLSSTCGINQRELKGIFLVSFHNCTIIIGNKLFENYEIQFRHPIIAPLRSNQIAETHLEKYVNISQLHDLHIENRKTLQSLELKQHLSIGSFICAVILITIILGIVYHKTRISSTALVERTGRASLRDGGVNSQRFPRTSPVADDRDSHRTNTAASAIAAPASVTYTVNKSCIALPALGNSKPTEFSRSAVS